MKSSDNPTVLRIKTTGKPSEISEISDKVDYDELVEAKECMKLVKHWEPWFLAEDKKTWEIVLRVTKDLRKLVSIAKRKREKSDD
jgi:hypothetical protein|tara:strand:+ start:1941 stop:2195 length:255 start_codon:yes stop_codon:yes gene_type:complete